MRIQILVLLMLAGQFSTAQILIGSKKSLDHQQFILKVARERCDTYLVENTLHEVSSNTISSKDTGMYDRVTITELSGPLNSSKNMNDGMIIRITTGEIDNKKTGTYFSTLGDVQCLQMGLDSDPRID